MNGPTGWRIAIAAASLLVAMNADGQQLTVTTSPSPPKANQPFLVKATGILEAPTGPPSVQVTGGTVTVVYHGSACDFLCVPLQLTTLTAIAPPLAPGAYVLTVELGVVVGAHHGEVAFSVAPAATVSYTGLWWKPSEPGWGLSIEHQADTLFAVWFTYAPDGSSTWLVISNAAKTADATYAGTVYRTTGPPFASGRGGWNPSSVDLAAVGTASLEFTDANNGTFSYSVDGIADSKSVTRQLFAVPGP